MSKRRREADEFPQQLQDAFTCASVNPLISVTTSSVITQTLWTLPVELDLNHPIFIECSKIHCTQETPFSVNGVATAIAGAPSQVVIREIKVMKEARGTTTWPDDNDRSTLITFRMQSSYMGLAAARQGLTYTEMDKWAYFEDARTGYGELIAQPRLFVLTRTTVAAADGVDPLTVLAKNLFLSMHYRLTTRVQGKEYLTELIAKFT